MSQKQNEPARPRGTIGVVRILKSGTVVRTLRDTPWEGPDQREHWKAFVARHAEAVRRARGGAA